MSPVETQPTAVYVTEGLLEALLDLASEAEPGEVSTPIATVPAGDLEGPDADRVPEATPVFAEYRLPDPNNALAGVFGVELSRPNRDTQGRFLSHPSGLLEVTMEDDLAEVVIVAVPPWEPTDDALAAFDRGGSRRSIVELDAAPPVEPFES
ncbi:hypothetical protein [Halovivax limisalsi]|uniref:hypothetical protein n=1 Tax=Halovivax limisalsi TaxID=1453760 RepID=UPI001FFD832F|nr:hypothetical protein [Halovivax limisalsi]